MPEDLKFADNCLELYNFWEMEKNKKSFLGKIFSGKNDGDVKPAGKKCMPCGAINAPDAKFCFACGSAFPVIYDSFDAFISYRRETASDLASLLKVQLENNFHKRIFIDIKELQVGRFDEALLRRIEDTPNFILILSKSSLDRCQEKSDWLKREIVHALETGRNIIPIMMKGFEFPTEHTWALLPPEMRVLSSLNGISYDHIHQDSAIRKVASYMKSAKEVPPAKFVPVSEDPEIPPPLKPETTKPEPTKPVQTKPEPTKPEPGKPEPRKPETAGATYFPVTGVLVKDSTGTETILTEFGVRSDGGAPSLENALRDDLTIKLGQGTKTIPWGQITSIEIQSRDDATFKLCDGKSLEHVKLAPTRLVGKNPDDFSFSFDFNNPLTITTLRDSTLMGCDELIHNISILAKRANPQANRWILTIRPEGEGVSVTAENYYYSELKNTHSFMLPGQHKFSAQGAFIGFTIGSLTGLTFSMGPFPVETAISLTMALNRLNSLLSDKNSQDEKEETTENVNPESFVFLKRGEFLTVGSRDSKTRSYYFGPGTVLQVKEKGKGSVYSWYRFQGADGNDYWFEGPGTVDTVDRRCFFRIAATGHVGYMAEILGERTDPWGSIEEFKIDDDTLGPTVVRFDQIVSMTSKNGEITVQKESGFLSGTLQKLANYNGGSWTKGPCLVTSDAVIPLARTNRVSSMTATRINESEKPPLIPALIYSDKTQLKFISQTNSSVGHFDGINPDMYIQLDEKELGRMRISIPQIVRISVDPASVEGPVTVETTSGRVYKGICLDPFNFSGSVITFDNLKKAFVLEAQGQSPVK